MQIKTQVALAKQHATLGNLEEAQQLYAQALLDGTTQGVAEVELADIRAERAALLLKLKRVEEAIAEYEQAARSYEVRASTGRLMIRLEHAQNAAVLLMTLCRAYLSTTNTSTHEKRQLVDRMLAMNKLIKKRFEVKVALLFQATELLLALKEDEQARTSLEQAERFYSQQLMNAWGIEGLRMQLERLREEIPSQAERSLACTLTAETPEDLELILNHLRQHVPGFTVTRGVQGTRPKDWRSATHYTARVRFVIEGQRASRKT